MTEDTKIILVKGMTDETDDSLVSAYLELASEVILNHMYPYTMPDNAVMPERYGKNQVEIAAYLLNKRGAEGELHHSENGTLRIYDSPSVPASYLRDIIPYAEVVA